MAYDPERIRYITENFKALQGLRLVPLGLFFLYWAAEGLGWIHPMLGFPIGVVLFLIYMGIGGWYRRTVGDVEAADASIKEAALTIMFLVVLGAVGWVDSAVDWPIQLTYLLLGAVCFLPYYSDRSRWHYAALGIVFIGFGLSPIWWRGTVDASAWSFDGPVHALILGVGLLVVGVLDHRLLLRSLPPLPDGEVPHV